MSDKDLISREKLLHTLEGWLKLNARVVPTEIGKALYMMIADYPAVPQEMSAVEYVDALERMFVENHQVYDEWYDVMLADDGDVRENRHKAVSIVEAWAREHPEERSKK